MNVVEQAYRKHVASMSGQERVARSLSLFDSVTTMIAGKIQRTHPGVVSRELTREIARQLYRNDSAIQLLLNET